MCRMINLIKWCMRLIYLEKILMDKLSSEEFNKMFRNLGINLTNSEIKDIENKRMFWKGTTRESIIQGQFLIFLRPLMTVCLPLMKSVLKTLAKSVLVPLGL